MGDLIDLSARRKAIAAAQELDGDITYNNHLSGPAKCLACGHEWLAKDIPTGETIFDLVCPKCDLRRGQLHYAATLGQDMLTWTHKCGSQHFTPTYVDPNGRVHTTEDAPLLHTAGPEVAEIRFLCHGCGELIDPNKMW